ncbi:family 16 glycosylhydrolase [Porphyromonadaceae sp. NP-X]|nr:family 16 glycosylhydrolase [Porphyromonadaceae sp. NP-X]NLJ21317.1 family 16 glycosylhydrolase [Bacteroidales bacterium]
MKLLRFFSFGVFLIFSCQINSQSNDYHLVWQDTFDGNELNLNNWVIEVNGSGNGNNELEYYRKENVSIGTEPVSGEKCLVLTAKKENYLGKTCTSGRINSLGKISFKHGKIEARIKLPHTANGLWPAFWLMGANYPSVGWPKCGEIDILEMGNSNGIKRGTQDKYFSSWFHWGESWNGGSYPNWGKDFTNSTSIQEDFHLFTLIWDEHSLKTYFDLDKDPNKQPIVEMAIDGEDVAGNAAHYFHKPFFVIFNLAIGGNFTGIWDINNVTALNQSNNYQANMYVDYVKIYQKGDASEDFSGSTMGMESVQKKNKFTVSPNPFIDQINISGETIPRHITIFSITGNSLIHIENSDIIDTSRLSNGVYFLSITDMNGDIETHKLIKKYRN